MRKMKIVFLVAAALILTACGGISKTVDMKCGESYKMEEEKLEGKNDVAWESEDSNIVTVSDRGTVTAKAPGKAKVLIKEGDKEIGKYTFNVTIVPIEQIILLLTASKLKMAITRLLNTRYFRKEQVIMESHGLLLMNR